MKKQVKDILSQIVRESTAVGKPPGELLTAGQGLTSLGVPLVQREEGLFAIDLTSMKVFTGMAAFIQMLSGEVMDQCQCSEFDTWVKYKIDSRATPELAATGISHICIYCRNSVSRQLSAVPEKFSRQMMYIFSTIQISKWGSILFPEYFGLSDAESGEQPSALLFPFHLTSGAKYEDNYFFLVEHEKASGFLRITIEDSRDSRLHLRHIRHRVVAHLGRGEDTVSDYATIAEAVFHGILLEWRNDRDLYVETESQRAGILRMLQSSGYGISTLTFHWSVEKMDISSTESQTKLVHLIAKIVLLLTDKDILSLLASGNTVEMISGGQRAYLEVSHRRMFLNVGLGEKRRRLSMNYFLERMPQVRGFTESQEEVLKGFRVFLIHHSTAEVLGLIKSLQKMGCGALHTFFIKYAGIVPADYLEAVLTLPEDRFKFHSLQQIKVRNLVTGSFSLSRDYSCIEEFADLDAVLQSKTLDLFSAMKLASGHMFLKEAMVGKKTGERLVLIEDGGYLAPVINRLCLENRTLGDVLQAFDMYPDKLKPCDARKLELPSETDLGTPFYDWLAPFYAGSCEVTRNGHNQLEELMRKHERLAFPACSIAVSNLKRGWEARENATAIIGSIESIMSGMGLIISQRRALVFGSRGAIGGNIMNDLSCKMGADNVSGVDIVIDPETYAGSKPNSDSKWVERRMIDELPEDVLHNTDLFIGVIGTSILTPGQLNEILRKSQRNRFIFVSGSTKTLEFEQLSDWLNGLLNPEDPRIDGIPVNVEMELLRDPQTRAALGRYIRITFYPRGSDRAGASFSRDLYLFADLTPINFLYYGTPCEVTDHVIKQLLQVTVGLVKSSESDGNRLPPRLLSVDRQIDADANIISSEG